MCTVVVVVTESKNIMSKTDRAESKLALASVAEPGSGYEQAVTSQTLVRARSSRGIRARVIFLNKEIAASLVYI